MIFVGLLLVFCFVESSRNTMDFQSSWLSQVSCIFHDDALGNIDGASQDTMDIQISLKEKLRKHTRSWWNKAALEQYLVKELVPRGLRIQVFPSFPMEDEVLKV